MFRHSEIYSLLRKRQLRKENGLVDEDPGLSTTALDPSHKPSDRGLGEGVNKSPASPVPDETSDPNGPVLEKRDFGNNGKQKGHKAAPSLRRQVRELDCVIEGVGFLDYGEEPAIKSQEKEAAGRALVDYADIGTTIDPLASRDTGSSKQGRKIWWPAIG